MDILFFLPLAVLLWNFNYKKNINEGCLCVSEGLSWKGFLAIVVVFHHLALYTDSGKIFKLFTYAGYLAVAVFFFFSGYGLQKKHISDESYEKGYIKKRIPKILYPYILITAFYWLAYTFDKKMPSVNDILTGIIKVDPIAKFSWYVIVVLIFYIVFFFLMKIFKRNYNLMIWGAVAFCVLWTVLCIFAKIERYITAPLLVMGMVFATQEQKLLSYIRKHYFSTLFAIIVGFVVFFLAPKTIDQLKQIVYAKDFMKTLSATFFTLFVLLISMKFRIGNPILDFIGKISFELYLSHGLFIFLLRSDVLNIASDLLYSLLVLVLSIAFSFGFSKLCTLMLSGKAR